MSLTPGDRIGPYEVVGPLGAGGMGEVYRARDAKIGRDVALKVLPELFTDDPERLARFEREAQALGALNHPNIAHIYGFEQQDNVRAIAMELVEGQTLEEMIDQGSAVPVADALPIARQIADALEAAHERNIIHRDLKPANVKVRGDGTVKVLDFGLAKALVPGAVDSGSDQALANSPTLTARSTQLGMIIGTAAYMAPEQARGKPVDRRADIWAFGVVLYEMLTARRAFAGDDITAVLARVIEREADLDQLPPATPRAIRQLLTRCLTKDPRQRLRDIGEARVTLDDVIAGRDAGTAAAIPDGRSRSSRRAAAVLPWAVAGALGLVSLFLWTRPGEPATEIGSVSAALILPPDVEFHAKPALSADGTLAAFVGVHEGIRQIYTRRVGSFEVVPLAGSEGALDVALSPDGTAVAMTASGGVLTRLAVDRSTSQQLATDATGSLVWGADDRIVFGRDGRLWSVAASGGDARTLTTLDAARTETAHRFPVVSSDGRFVYYNSVGGPDGAEVHLNAVGPGGGVQSVVLADDYQPVWASPDRLVLARDGAVFVADLRDGRFVETPVRLFDDVAYNVSSGWSAAMSDTGSLLVAGGDVARARLVWVSSEGVETPVGGAVRDYENPRVSPDGRLVLFNDAGGLWTMDITRGAVTRVAANTARYATWTGPTHLAYRTLTGLAIVSAEGTGTARTLTGSGYNDYPSSASPDGTTLAVVRITPETSGDVYLFSIDKPDPPRPFVATPAYEGGAQFSPDGRWMVYTSDEGGQAEVYLTPYPVPARRFSVSSGGGLHPLWSKDGRQIFYRSGQRMMAVDVTLGTEPQLGTPRLLFEQQYKFGPNLSVAHYSLSHDGQRLLMVKEEPGARSLSLITNWLKK